MTAQLLAPQTCKVELEVHKFPAYRSAFKSQPAGFEATAQFEELVGIGRDADQVVAEALAVKYLKAAYAVKYPKVPDTFVDAKTLYVDFA